MTNKTLSEEIEKILEEYHRLLDKEDPTAGHWVVPKLESLFKKELKRVERAKTKYNLTDLRRKTNEIKAMGFIEGTDDYHDALQNHLKTKGGL